MRLALLATASLLFASVSPHAQVPIPGQTPGTIGVIGLDGTVDKFYSGTHRAIVKTADGVRHVVHLNDRTVVHGGRSTADDAFRGLEDGSRVVVHYVVEGDRNMALEIDHVGDDGLTLIEGTVTRLDRHGKKMTLQLADGSVVRLRLTDRAAHHAGKDVDGTGKVVVYYADDGGERVAHYFRKAD